MVGNAPTRCHRGGTRRHSEYTAHVAHTYAGAAATCVGTCTLEKYRARRPSAANVAAAAVQRASSANDRGAEEDDDDVDDVDDGSARVFDSDAVASRGSDDVFERSDDRPAAATSLAV